MKARLVALIAIGVLIAVTSIASAAPKAVAVNPKYIFPPMAEGQGMTHEFTIKNEGDTELNIIGVYPP